MDERYEIAKIECVVRCCGCGKVKSITIDSVNDLYRARNLGVKKAVEDGWHRTIKDGHPALMCQSCHAFPFSSISLDERSEDWDKGVM